jgi:hypothetical protein
MAGDELDKFVGEILEAKKLPGFIDEEVRQQLQADLKQNLLGEINKALINALSDDKASELNNLLDDESTTEEKVQELIMQSGIDVQRITTQTMLLFRSLYLETAMDRDASNG